MSKATAREIAHRKYLFEQKFRRYGENECWPWIAGQNQYGNGIFRIGALGSTATKPAHVVAWMFYRDPLYDLDSSDIFHRLCGLPNCVNPRHMAVVNGNGLVNLAEVTLFLASRCTPVAAELLLSAAKAIESEPHGYTN